MKLIPQVLYHVIYGQSLWDLHKIAWQRCQQTFLDVSVVWELSTLAMDVQERQKSIYPAKPLRGWGKSFFSRMGDRFFIWQSFCGYDFSCLRPSTNSSYRKQIIVWVKNKKKKWYLIVKKSLRLPKSKYQFSYAS